MERRHTLHLVVNEHDHRKPRRHVGSMPSPSSHPRIVNSPSPAKRERHPTVLSVKRQWRWLEWSKPPPPSRTCPAGANPEECLPTPSPSLLALGLTNFPA